MPATEAQPILHGVGADPFAGALALTFIEKDGWALFGVGHVLVTGAERPVAVPLVAGVGDPR
jgi:hypothetical protein